MMRVAGRMYMYAMSQRGAPRREPAGAAVAASVIAKLAIYTSTLGGSAFALPQKLLLVRLVHRSASLGDPGLRRGFALDDLRDRVAERRPVIAELDALRTGETRRRCVGERLHERVTDGDVGADRHVAGYVRVDLLRVRVGEGERESDRTVDVLGALVDVPTVNAGERSGFALRARRDRGDAELCAKVLLVVAEDPRPVDDHVDLPRAEGRVRPAAIGLELGAGRLEAQVVCEGIGPATLVRDAFAVRIHEAAAERRGPTEHVVRVLVLHECLACLEHRHELIGGLRWGRHLVLVVVERDRFEEHGHAIQLAVDLEAIDAELRDVAELAGQLGVERHQEVRPNLVAELIVRCREEVRPAARGGLGLELVEDLVERHLKNRDLRGRVVRSDLRDELVESLLFGAARSVRVPERDVPRDRAGRRAGARARATARARAGGAAARPAARGGQDQGDGEERDRP